MTALVRAELLKLRTAPRTVLGLVLGLLAIVGIGTAASVDSISDSPTVRPEMMRDIVSGGGIAAPIFALLVGILVVTWEYRHGTIGQTFLVAPRRERVVAAKAVAAATAGLVLAVLALAVALAIAIPWLSGHEGFDLGDRELWERAARLLPVAALWGLLGVALGALIHSQVGAIVSALVWFFIAEQLVGALWSGGRDYLPGFVMNALLGWEEDALEPRAAVPVAFVYVLAIGTLGLLFTHRRDVS